MENGNNQEMNIFTMTSRLGRAIYGVIKWILSILGYILRAAYQYKLLFLCFALLAIGFSLYESREDNRTYEGFMHLKLNDGESVLYQSLVRDLNEFSKEEDAEGLAKELDVSVDLAARIVKLDAHHVIDKYRDSTVDYVDYKNNVPLGDTIDFAVPDQLVISARVKGIEEFGQLEEALKKYFSKNDYLVSLNIARIKLQEEKEWMFHNALMNLDSLQKVEYFKNNNGGNYLEFSSINEKKASVPFIKAKKQMFYDDIQKLFKITGQIEEDMSANLDVVTVLSDFHPVQSPVNSLSKLLLRNGLIALALFLIVAMIWRYKKNIRHYLSKGI
ncbi:MAG: hypothetical protein K6F48_05395 [Paludibacteraceae bacterium]|nr:hypothetical protein [Paludibacteraceae bacterium]